MDGSVASMMALQQSGSLVSDKVLPHFAKRMSEAARANGGLDKAMLSNRVAMNRLMFSFQEAADLIFKSGFAKGLTELFNELAKSVIELKNLWESLGKVIGSVFSLLADGVALITPTLIALSSVFKSMVDSVGDGREYLLAMIAPAMWLSKIFGGFGWKMIPIVGQFVTLLSLIKEIAFWAEEIDNLLFSRNKIGILYDPRTGANTNNIIDYLTPFSSPDAIKKQLSALNKESNPRAGLSQLPDWLKSVGGAFVPPEYLGKKPVQVNVTVDADAEKIGITVSQSTSMKDSINDEIRKVQN